MLRISLLLFRAFYLSLTLSLDLSLAVALNLNLNLDSMLDINRDLYIALDIAFDPDRDFNFASIRHLYLDYSHDRGRNQDLAPSFKQSLQTLRNQLPFISNEDRKKFYIPNEEDRKKSSQWWAENRMAWAENLRVVMTQHRDIGHDWQFSPKQKALLQQYYDTNKLLVDCLNSDCYVSREVRQKIEAGGGFAAA